MKLTSNKACKEALAWVEENFQSQPGEPGYEQLDMFANAIVEWENKHYPIEWPKVKISSIISRNRDAKLRHELGLRPERQWQRMKRRRSKSWLVRTMTVAWHFKLYGFWERKTKFIFSQDPNEYINNNI